MNIRSLLKKVTAVATGIAAFIGKAQGSPSQHVEHLNSPNVKLDFDPPTVEPLVLKPADVPENPALLVGHRSHSSHSSHRSHSSHYSGTSGVVRSPQYTPSPAPGYAPYTPPTPAYTPPASTYVPPSAYTPPKRSELQPTSPSVAPAEQPSEVTKLEFNNGLILYGYVLAKSSEGIAFRSLDNKKTFKFRKELLTPVTVQSLQLPPKTANR